MLRRRVFRPCPARFGPALRQIALEADERDLERGVAWSVVVKGVPELLDNFTEIEDAERLEIHPWTGTPKDRFVRIAQTRITGRRAYAPAPPPG